MMDLLLVLALLLAAIVLFGCDRPRMDVPALLMIAGLPLTGVVTVAVAASTAFATPVASPVNARAVGRHHGDGAAERADEPARFHGRASCSRASNASAISRSSAADGGGGLSGISPGR